MYRVMRVKKCCRPFSNDEGKKACNKRRMEGEKLYDSHENSAGAMIRCTNYYD
jgi:hypothetical protein